MGDDASPATVSKKRSYHHGDLRRAVIHEAIRHTRIEGERAIILREIANDVGVSATAAYRHFASRAHLVDQVSIRGFEVLGSLVDQPVTNSNDDAAVVHGFRDVCAAYVDFAWREQHWFRMMSESLQSNAQARDELAAIHKTIARNHQALVDVDIVKPGTSLVEDVVFWSGLHGFAMQLVEGVVEVDGSWTSRSMEFHKLLDTLTAPGHVSNGNRFRLILDVAPEVPSKTIEDSLVYI